MPFEIRTPLLSMTSSLLTWVITQPDAFSDNEGKALLRFVEEVRKYVGRPVAAYVSSEPTYRESASRAWGNLPHCLQHARSAADNKCVAELEASLGRSPRLSQLLYPMK